MKYKFFIIIFILSLISKLLLSQEIKIKITTPLLRQNNNLWINLDFLFFKDHLAKQLNKSLENPDDGSMIFTLFPKDTGEIQIGPIELIFDSIKYKSNIVKIKVLPTIEPKVGIYINSYYYEGKNFVLIDQVYENEEIKNKYSSTYSYSGVTGSYIDNFAYLDFSSNNKIKIISNQKTTAPLWVKGSKTNNASLYCSTKFFEIVNNSGHKIILTKEFFKNLPPNFILPKVEIW